MPGWSQRPLFKNPTNMTGGGPVGMPKGMSVPGYQDGNVVEEMPTYRREQLAKEAEYQKAIEKAASLFSSSDPNRPRLLRDYGSEVHWHAKSIAGGHQVPEEQVMQDLEKAIEAQRGAPKMKAGGIVGLENGGMTPELFEGEEIVETNPMINEMAGQGGAGIASVSAEPASGAMPERGVPNERGIIELAMDTEEVETENDEPIIAFAKQEAQSRLDEEFNILKSTAQAEAASGNPPSAVIKSSMDDLALSARRIENETVEKYPEVPANANLISSDDLVPYREELVTIFETPEIGGEEPLMDTSILTAKNGGKIPGYKDGGVSYAPGEGPDSIYKRGRIKAGDWGPGKKDYFAPEDISWMSEYAYGRELIEAVNNNEISVEDAKRLLAKEIGPTLSEVSSTYASPREIKRRREQERKQERSKMDLSELRAAAEADKDRDPREEDFLDNLIKNEAGAQRSGFLSLGRQMGNTGLLGSIKEAAGDQDRTMLLLQNPEFANLLNEYQRSKEPRQEIEEIEVTAKKRDEQTKDQGPTGRKEQMGPPQYDDVPPELSPAEKLKKTYGGQIDTLVDGYSDNVTGYDEKADKQDEEMLAIFDEMEAAIPERARLAGRRTPYTGGGAQAFLVRRLAGQQIEGELNEGLRLNKLTYYELRKKETEARRAKDYDALTSLTEQKIKILSDIDLSVFDAETAQKNAIEVEELKFDLNMQLELFKYNLDPKAMDASLASIPELEKQLANIGERDIQAAVISAKGAEAAVKYYGEVFEGAKTFKDTAGNSVVYTFPEMYRAYLGQLDGGAIVTLWKKQPKG